MAISSLLLVAVLPLDFHGWLRVFRSMFFPCALRGFEASLLAQSSTLKLRAAILNAVWSRRQPLAIAGAVLSLLDGPQECDAGYCVVWFRFRLMRVSCVLVFGCWQELSFAGHGSGGCPKHTLVQMLVASAAWIGFGWISICLVGCARVCLG